MQTPQVTSEGGYTLRNKMSSRITSGVQLCRTEAILQGKFLREYFFVLNTFEQGCLLSICLNARDQFVYCLNGDGSSHLRRKWFEAVGQNEDNSDFSG